MREGTTNRMLLKAVLELSDAALLGRREYRIWIVGRDAQQLDGHLQPQFQAICRSVGINPQSCVRAESGTILRWRDIEIHFVPVDQVMPEMLPRFVDHWAKSHG